MLAKCFDNLQFGIFRLETIGHKGILALCILGRQYNFGGKALCIFGETLELGGICDNLIFSSMSLLFWH